MNILRRPIHIIPFNFVEPLSSFYVVDWICRFRESWLDCSPLIFPTKLNLSTGSLQVAKITSAKIKLDEEASASELFSEKEDQNEHPTASDELGPAGSNCQCSFSSDDDEDSDDIYEESELEDDGSGSSDNESASSSYKGDDLHPFYYLTYSFIFLFYKLL